MSEEVFRWVITIGVGLSWVMTLVTAGAMLAIYRTSKRLEERVGPLADKAGPILDRARSLVEEAGPKIQEMLDKASEMTTTARDQVALVLAGHMHDGQICVPYPGGKLREPAFWRDGAWNNPSQPVVGVCWFEARAYTIWLSAQAGDVFRLPTEAEWEVAARGREARLYAYGNEFDPLKGNNSETRIRRTTPVGVFVEGDTPEGVSDLTGNVDEWTASLFGAGGPNEPATFGYPYRPGDGREDPSAGAEVRRVLRGGAWHDALVDARAAPRVEFPPDGRSSDVGFRLSAAFASPISILRH
jgi:formylglycine-generating enzyme required for sulfatase activity